MNKEELVKVISTKAKVSQKEAAACLNATLDVISRALVRGQKVTLVGFGSFQIRQRAAREGRNPRTGGVLHIPAKRSAVWIAGKPLKERIERKYIRQFASAAPGVRR